MNQKVVLTVALSVWATIAWTQTQAPVKSPKPEAKAAPVISADLQKEFFKAQAQLLAAQRAVEQAQKEVQTHQETFQAKIKKAMDACGADHQLSQNQSTDPEKAGDLICVDKPKPAEAKK